MSYLTIGEIYDATNNRYDDKYYDILIHNYGGWTGIFYKDCFKSLAEIRSKKIDKLLTE
jgi:hypothetical protein